MQILILGALIHDYYYYLFTCLLSLLTHACHWTTVVYVANTNMYACMHVCMHACMHVCMYVCTYVCMYVSEAVYKYADVYLHVFM